MSRISISIRKKYWRLAVTCFVHCFAFTSQGRILDENSYRLTLQDVFKLAEKNSNGLERSRLKSIEMQASTKVAYSNFIPNIGLQSTLSSNEFLLSQKIYDGGASLAEVSLSKHREGSSKIEQLVELAKIRGEVIDAFYDAIISKRTTRFLDESSEKIESAMRRVEMQFKYRAIGRDAFLRAKVQIRKSRSEYFEARDAESEAVRKLSRLTHLANFKSDWLVDNIILEQLPKPLALQPLTDVDSRLRNRPQRELLQISGQMLNDEKEIALATDRINVSFNASYGFGQRAPNFSVGYVYAVGFQYGLSLSIPFSSGYSIYAKKKVYSERQHELERDLRILDDDAQFDYSERVEKLRRGWADILAINQELSASEDIWKEADANFKVGVSSPDLWFEASANVRQWKLRQLQKIKSYLIEFDRVNALVQTTQSD